MPRGIVAPARSIKDFFVHGTTSTQRAFFLTEDGDLYAYGDNTLGICTGGLMYSTTNTTEVWAKPLRGIAG